MSDAALMPTGPKSAKKPKSTKPKGPKKASSHPSYHDMITKAIESLKERGGSSRQAIQKYIQANYKTCNDKVSQAHLKLALKRGADGGGYLKRVKGAGALGSFRLADKAKAGEGKPKGKKSRSGKKSGAGRPKSTKPKKSAEKKASKPKVKKPKVAKKAGAPKAVKHAA